MVRVVVLAGIETEVEYVVPSVDISHPEEEVAVVAPGRLAPVKPNVMALDGLPWNVEKPVKDAVLRLIKGTRTSPLSETLCVAKPEPDNVTTPVIRPPAASAPIRTQTLPEVVPAAYDRLFPHDVPFEETSQPFGQVTPMGAERLGTENVNDWLADALPRTAEKPDTKDVLVVIGLRRVPRSTCPCIVAPVLWNVSNGLPPMFPTVAPADILTRIPPEVFVLGIETLAW
jgi:hypothetical protein